jgi:hypothetical protein
MMDAFVYQSWRFLRGRIGVLSQQVPNTEPSQRCTAVVQKDPLVSRIIGGGNGTDEILKQLCRALPYGAKPDFVAFAIQANLTGRFKAKVTDAKVQDFLNPRAELNISETGAQFRRTDGVS